MAPGIIFFSKFLIKEFYNFHFLHGPLLELFSSAFVLHCVPTLIFVPLMDHLLIPIFRVAFVIKYFMLVICPMILFGCIALAFVLDGCFSAVYVTSFIVIDIKDVCMSADCSGLGSATVGLHRQMGTSLFTCLGFIGSPGHSAPGFVCRTPVIFHGSCENEVNAMGPAV